MELQTKDGNLTLGSAYRLIVTAWIISWGVFVGFIMLFLILTAALTGTMMINGEMVSGRGTILMDMLPILALFPMIIVLHAFMFGGFLVFGLWVYRLKKPIKVVSDKS